MKHLLFSLTCCSFLALPLSSFAAEHDHSQHMMPSGGGHDATQMMHNDSIMLGEQTVDNVKAMAHLNDVGAVMAKMGKKENYHFMVMFSDAKTGAAIDQGTVAVKITDPATGQAGAAIALFMPWCQLRRGNIIVDFFTAKMPDRVNAGLDRFGALVLALVMLLLAWRTVVGGIGSYESQTTTMMLGFPEWIVYAAMVPPLFLTGLIGLTQAFVGDFQEQDR